MHNKIFDVSKGARSTADYSRYNISVITTGDAVIKCQGSFEAVDFSKAPSAENPWSYVGLMSLENGEFLEGNTGLIVRGAGVFLLSVNAESLSHIAFDVSGEGVTIRSYLS